ncbi:N-acetylglucosamine-6-phosphate deacetylase [Sphingomonas sp. IBVSS2]|uniref:N-acetylglucosamine-6-phosphate deacetylase n=1 Tax=Sphingomonas sp. IBVSS2 TaxID=1985172 RepID=UPI000A2E6877|nr:N-acetylglucosamine-6-phosphate deacetylase [Sphingomonas sp. IBVSS2]OSZ70379.1 N-acetylglucosamine-6-phosphate deacetylase [Sphingomonas sp. IBVSS2]
MMHALIPTRALVDGALREDVAVLIDGARIAGVVPADAISAGVESRHLDGMLVPGFIDTQVNGGGGVLFNDAPTVEGIAAIGAAHRRFGTTGFLPTLISDDLDVIRRAVAAVDAAIAAGIPGVLGIHIEGPFLNADRKGIHSAEKIRLLDAEGITALTGLTRGRTLVTLAPERVAVSDIEQLVAAGVVVAAGHTNARYDQAKAAVAAGMRGVTHLFNAMSPLGSREPGMVGAALDSGELVCGLIVDGHHVNPATLRLALRCKPASGFMLVTDAMPSVGSDASEFVLQGRHITVKDGACRSDDGTLAGSHLDMAAAVRNAVSMLGVDLATAVTMASASPAALMGLGDTHGRIATGQAADVVLLDDAGQVRETWIGGA